MVIRIVTDTGVSLPLAVINAFDIAIVSGIVELDGEQFLEYPDLPPSDFYQRLANAGFVPTIWNPTVKAFRDVYSRLLDETPGATILSLHMSEAVAININQARQAADSFPEADIRIIDTRSMALGQGLMVHEAALMVRAGASIAQIIERLEAVQDRMLFYLAASSTAYLAISGRSGHDGHQSDEPDDARPVLTMGDGVVEAVEFHETRTQALLAMRQLALQTERLPGMRLGVMYGNCEAEAIMLSKDIGGKLRPETLLIAEIGATVGVNTGPGALGFCWYALENE